MTTPSQSSTSATSSALATAFSGEVSHPGSSAPSSDANYGQFGDDQGRAVTTPENAHGQQPSQEGREPASVPSFRLREETEARRQAENAAQNLLIQNNQLGDRIAQLEGYIQGLAATAPQQGAVQPQPQQQFKIPDLVERPEEFFRAVQAMVLQTAETVIRAEVGKGLKAMSDMKLDVADAMAEQVYGRDLIRKATHAAKAAGLKDQFMATPNPVTAAIRWYQGQQTQQMYGTDPAAIRQNVLTELLSDPQAVAQIVAAATGRPAPQGQNQQPAPAQGQRQIMPPPLNGMPRGSGTPNPAAKTTGDALREHFAGRSAAMRGTPVQAAS